MPDSVNADPLRSLSLLWRRRLPEPPPRRGPRARIGVDDVVAVAIRLADREGIAAVTVRAVAAAAGVSPMAIYSHVPDKETLLDLMTDQALVDMAVTATNGPTWRDRLRVLAEDNLRLHRAHPWLAGRHTERPGLGPGLFDKYERELAAFTGLGLSAVDTDACLSFLLNFVRGAAADLAAADRDAGTDNLAWWGRVGPALAELTDPAEYPLSTEIGSRAGEALRGAHNAEHAYRFGLERVLDGIGALIGESPGAPNHRS